MILPESSFTSLLLLAFSMLCFAIWANTQKAIGKWRFELYYLDFALGMLLCAIVLALTFGTLGNNLSVEDNLQICGKRQIAYGMAAGGIFALANMLLSGAISVAGMSVAFPISFAVSMILGLGISFFTSKPGGALSIALGVVLLGASIAAIAIAHSLHTMDILKTLPPGARRRKDSAGKGILLSCVSGFFLAFFFPMVELAKATEIGLGPYTAGLFVAIGAFIMVFPLNLYFMNLPVSGESIGFAMYGRGSFKQHILGLLGGAIAGCGLIGALVALSVPKQHAVSSPMSYALVYGAPLLSIILGLLIWKEFSGATGKTPLFFGSGAILFAAALGVVAYA